MHATLPALVAAERTQRALVSQGVTDGWPVWEIALHGELARTLRRRITALTR